MDTTTQKLMSLVEDLDDDLDDLEESLAPLLEPVLVETASKYPVLDRAKLYVLVTYAVESMLFSYLRLHGVKAREHAVFTELARVKQYFEKLKLTENPVGKRENLTLDKAAAARIIKASLAGNNAGEEWTTEKESERARAHIKFEQLSEKMKQDEISKMRKVEESIEDTSEDSGSGSSLQNSPTVPDISGKKKKRQSLTDSVQASAASSPLEVPQTASKSKKRRSNKKSQKGKK